MEESKFPEEFSLIEKYNLRKVKTAQKKYLICWAHALAEMITDSVQIYQIESKRRKIDETYEDTSILDYVYTTSLIWITSHHGFRRKKFDFLFDTQTYVSSEKCYPFEQTIFKLVNDNPSTPKPDYIKDAKYIERTKYQSQVTKLLQPPYFQNMDKMKDKDGISYIDKCKYNEFDDKLYEPLNKDNEIYVNFTFKPYVDKMYSVLFENNLCKVGLFNSPEINIDWEKHQKKMKELLLCGKIIKAGFILMEKFYYKYLDNLEKNYDNFMYFGFHLFKKLYRKFSHNVYYKDDDYDKYDEEDCDNYGDLKIIYKKYKPKRIPYEENKEKWVFHKILIYGWVNYNYREYWIIRDSFFPDQEYYFPIAKKDDQLFLGLELKYGIIDIELSDYLKEKIGENVENFENFENVKSSIFER
jgi:hypothetical protein